MNIYTEIAKKVFIDKCSGVPELMLNSCCHEHDDDYKTMGKFKADWKFIKCGWKKAATYTELHKRIVTRLAISIYYLGVSIFGWWPHYKAQKSV